MEPKEKDTPAGVGPGITGASGEMIENTGTIRVSGAPGTPTRTRRRAGGHRIGSPHDATRSRAMRKGRARHRPLASAGAPRDASAVAARMPSRRAAMSAPGRPGGGGSGALSDVPGGIRNVSPANDNATDPDHIHEGQGQNRSERTNHIRAGNPGTDDEH